jgi:zinc protease
LSTTQGLASNILAVVQRGEEPDYIYKYPEELEAVTLEQVNGAIKKYIDLTKLVIVEAGSIDQNGKPLE